MEKEDYTIGDALKAHRASSEKFDYFILGIILALFSLSLQTFNPKPETAYVWFVYIFWFFLIISFSIGIVRQIRINLFLGADVDRLNIIENYEKPNKKNLVKKTELLMRKDSKIVSCLYVIHLISFGLALLIYMAFKIINSEIAQQAVQQ